MLKKTLAMLLALLMMLSLAACVINIHDGDPDDGKKQEQTTKDPDPTKDPDEFIRSHGADGPAAFKAVIEKSGNDVEYRLQKLKQIHNVETTERIRCQARLVLFYYS